MQSGKIPTPKWRKLTEEELFRPLKTAPIDVDADESEDRTYSDFDCVSMHEYPARAERGPDARTAPNGKLLPILYPSPIKCWKLVKNAIARSSKTAHFTDQLKDELNNAGFSRVAQAFQLKSGYSLEGRGAV